MENLWTALLKGFFNVGLWSVQSLCSTMDTMYVELFNVKYIEVLIDFFTKFGLALWAAGTIMEFFQCVIQSKNGEANIKGSALNISKGFIAASSFSVVPIALFTFTLNFQEYVMLQYNAMFDADVSTSSLGLASELFNSFSAMNSEPAVIIFVIIIAYSVFKVTFGNLKRAGTLLVYILLGSIHMISIPRGYMDGFTVWCKEVALFCLVMFLQNVLLFLGLLLCTVTFYLGLMLVLVVSVVPSIAKAMGADTSIKMNVTNVLMGISSVLSIGTGIKGTLNPKGE